jgi:hypothetical protein
VPEPRSNGKRLRGVVPVRLKGSFKELSCLSIMFVLVAGGLHADPAHGGHRRSRQRAHRNSRHWPSPTQSATRGAGGR